TVFQPLNADLEFLVHTPGGHDVFHLFHPVRHVFGIVLIHVLHIAFRLAHGAHHARIVKVRHSFTALITGCAGRRFLCTARGGETAHLLDHSFVTAFGTG